MAEDARRNGERASERGSDLAQGASVAPNYTREGICPTQDAWGWPMPVGWPVLLGGLVGVLVALRLALGRELGAGDVLVLGVGVGAWAGYAWLVGRLLGVGRGRR